MSKKLLSFITKHKTNELLKGALFLFSGTVIAQLISIVSLPVLQHYYPPEDFALLNTFTSLTVLISSVATFKLEYAIVPAKSSLEATKIALTSSIYVFLISLVSMLIFLLLPALILPKKLHEASLLFVIGVPLSTFLFANNEIVMFWQNRLGQFKRMSAGKIFNSASMESSRFIMLAINEKIPGLVIGRILGYATNLIYSLSSLGIKEMPKLFGLINWKVVKKISVRYKSFPLFTMPSSLLNNLTAYLFLYLFITFYNNHEAGLVTVANQY
ncbi:MAG: oligosaccharide flippase family protein, partial [Cyclobacteriaceae bacterium]|nr:oligosaccharide flippase family protein [Cyclobacteriaceae bacterium]